MTTGATIETGIVRKCKGRQEEALKLVLASGRGFPDRTILAPGGAIAFIEVKGDGDRLRPIQENWIRKLRKLGFTAGVAKSVDDAERLIKSASNPLAEAKEVIQDILVAWRREGWQDGPTIQEATEKAMNFLQKYSGE